MVAKKHMPTGNNVKGKMEGQNHVTGRYLIIWYRCARHCGSLGFILRLTVKQLSTPILILRAVHSGNLNWIAI